MRAGSFPLAVEGPVMSAVDRLVPGVSTGTRYIRHHSLYAAIAAHADDEGLDAARCRRLVRRCEVLLAALGHESASGDGAAGGAGTSVGGGALAVHGADRVRRFLTPDLELAGAADEEQPNTSYHPQRWGFWERYAGPAAALGLVEIREGALRPGRHGCPAAVREAFAPLLSLAGQDTVRRAQLRRAGQAAPGAGLPAERDWLADVVSGARTSGQVTAEPEESDRARRATLRALGRAVVLHGGDGDGYQEALRSAVAFGSAIADDPVLAAIPEAAGWRGLLLRHYSVGAWRRLWAALVAQIGSERGEADRSAGELREWLAQLMPHQTVRQALLDLPPFRDAAGQPLPAEREILRTGGDHPLTDVRLLLTGAQRAAEGALRGDVRADFLGRPRHGGEFLDPTWVAAVADDHRDRPLAELAGRLVDDMLAQSRRVALGRLRRDPATGGIQIHSRLHVRNERYFKTGDERAAEISTRIPQLGFLAEQLGLFTVPDDGCSAVTPAGLSALEVE
jgi:hypothetical protein